MRSIPASSPLMMTLVCACLWPAVVPAAVITQSVTGSLLGAQSLLQFNPSQGTLTGVTFELTSTATGTKTLTGTLVPATNGIPPLIPATGAFCLPGGGAVGLTITGYNSNLNTTLTSLLTSTGTPTGCTAAAAFTRNVNLGPTAGLGALSSYVGVGAMAFNFGISSATTATWTGTLSVNYTYQTPEPATWAMVGSALMALAWRRRRT